MQSQQDVDPPASLVAATEQSIRQRYSVSVASKGNKIELELTNPMAQMATNLSVEAVEIPVWLKLETSSKAVDKLAPGFQTRVSFMFDVKEDASVNQEGALTFKITDQEGRQWSKQVNLEVSASRDFKLLPNYPNPFNPATTIKYHLPAEMRVKVTVYNIIGRRVATLVDGSQSAGVQQVRFDASNLASGLYIYRVVAGGKNGKRIVEDQKMLLIK